MLKNNMNKKTIKISLTPHELKTLMGEAEAKDLLWRLLKLRKQNAKQQKIHRN